MLPLRCVRCGASSRDFLCPRCVDFLVADRPLWLDPALLPGPSLLDLINSKEVAILGTDLSQIEWHNPAAESTSADGVRLVELLDLDSEACPIVSVGDAEILHKFLRDARRATPAAVDEQAALAALYRYLGSREWMPPHLASEYALRANVVAPRTTETPEVATPAETVSAPTPAEVGLEAPPPLPEVLAEEVEVDQESPPASSPLEFEPPEEDIALPAAPPFPPEPIPQPEPPLPIPEPYPQPEPQPEPEPGPEEPSADASKLAELEAARRALEKERADAEAYVRSRTEELRAKEETVAAHEKEVVSREHDVEARDRAATERLLALEKDSARRDVLRFLGTIPGMSDAHADVIATAFPEMTSLRDADVKALTQCKGVSEALARAIRLELAPGEFDEERRSTQLREEAQAFIEEGDYQAALACYERLLRERPEDSGVWFDRAQLLVLSNRPEEAIQCYSRVLDSDRRNRRAWYERGNLLFGLGRLADAVDSLGEALRLDPSKSGEVVQKAEQLRRDRHPNEAVFLFQAILEIVPDDPRAILGLGDSLLDLGDADAAEALFTRALGKNAQNPTILYRKGELLDRKGRWGAAIQYYNRAIALRWNFADPWLAKGEILLNHDRVKEALESFEKVTTLDPGRVAAWAGQARAHAALGHLAEAEVALTRATELGADHPAVRAAQDAVAKVGPASPHAVGSHMPADDLPSLAKAFAEIEEDVEPPPPSPSTPSDFRSFVESIEPEKEDIQVLMQLAELAIEGGDPQMALLRYEQVIEREPRSADGWTGKGVALQHLERYREALEAFDRALSLKPNHELAQKWRSTCLRHLEDVGV